MKYEKIYQELRKKYTDEEIVEDMLLPADVTEQEAETLAQEMKAIRFQKLQETTKKDRIMAGIMQLRFQMENYLKVEDFSKQKTFGKYLAEYIRIVKKSRRDVANDLAIHYTKLSRIINDKEEPNIALSYRLEKHAGYLIQAKTWWKLMIKKQAFMISQDKRTRQMEQQKVQNAL